MLINTDSLIGKVGVGLRIVWLHACLRRCNSYRQSCHLSFENPTIARVAAALTNSKRGSASAGMNGGTANSGATSGSGATMASSTGDHHGNQ